MVQDTGAAKGPGRVRPLGLPQPIQVRADQRGWPLAVKVGHRWIPVTVEDRWRIDDEWWRQKPVGRFCFGVLVKERRPVTLFFDRVTGSWWTQGKI